MVTKTRRLKSVQVHLTLLGLCIAAIITALCLVWFDTANQPSLSSSFSYSADAVASETSYASGSPDPSSRQYFTSKLQLDLIGNEVKSSVVNSTATGDTISAVTSIRTVDPATGLYGGQPPNAYVMAPKNLKKSQEFQMRFPTYDTLATMEFQSEDTIQGIKTVVYKAHFDSPVQGIWEEEKVTYTPNLQLWIEPISGWLIKYQDDATVHSVGSDTQYSRISQKTSDESVRQHVSFAEAQKTRLVFAQQVAPGIALPIVFALGFILAISRMKRRTVPLYASLGVITIIPLLALAGWIIGSPMLTTLFISPAALNPLGALCFILVAAGIAFLYRNHRPVVAFIGGLVAILSTLQLLGNLGALPFSVDLLFFRDAVTLLDQTTPSRMSTFDAFTFLVISIALIKAGFTTKRTEIHFAKFIAGVAFSLGVFGLILQITQVDKAFSLTFIQSVPLVAPILFILASYSLMQLFRSIHDKPNDVRSTLATLRWPSIATVPLVIIGMFAQIQQNSVHQSLNNNFKEQTTAFETNLENRIAIDINTLRGTRALFAASHDVTADEFRRFVDNYRGDENLVGLDSIGFARTQTSRQSFINPYTNAEAPVFPLTENPTTIPIVYSESLDKGIPPAVGYDLASDRQLGQVLDQARDSGKTIMSGSGLLPTTDKTKTTNLLIVPIYQTDGGESTVASRQASLMGYIFGTVSISRLANTPAGDIPSIGYDIYDGLETQSDALLYSSFAASAPRATPRVADIDTRFIANHPFTIAYSAKPSFQLSPQEEFAPSLVLLGGSLGYFAALTVLYFLVDLERRAHIMKRLKKRGVS